MKILNIVVCTVVLALAGCNADVRPTSQEKADEVADQVVYSRDNRTGLCFAVIGSMSGIDIRSQSLSMTWVPCEPKVLELISE